MTDLLVTAMTPRLGSGTGLRTYGVAAALADLGPVEIGYVEFGGPEPAAEYASLPGLTLSGVPASRGRRRATVFARALGRRVPLDLARGVSAELIGFVEQAAPDTRVIADGPVVAAALLGLARRRPIVYLAHNLESAGFRGRGGQRGLRRFERRVLAGYAESWMATRADAAGARALTPRATTRYVPNVVDVEAITPVTRGGTPRLLLVADFTYPPNREAVGFLTAEVMPAIWAQDPDVRLRLVGRGLDGPGADARIETAGFVPRLRDAYDDVAVVLVPLLRGGGSPLKFVEGLAYGLPVVATGHAAALLEDGEAGRDFVVASGAAAYAEAVLARLADPAGSAAIGAAGRALAHRSYSVQTLVRLLSPPAAAPS